MTVPLLASRNGHGGLPTLLLRPDLGRKAYRLKCRFIVEAFPKEEWVNQAKFVAAQLFINSMAKQGWEHLEKYGFAMRGPFPETPITPLPKRPPDVSNLEALKMAEAGYHGRLEDESSLVASVLPLSQSENWEYELAGVFVHKTILVEYPDLHEERS